MDPPGEPQFNMDRDEAISRRAIEEFRPILRVYRWARPAVSLGRRQKREEVSLSAAQGFPMVWRPTGGGAVLHTLDELTYAFSAPRELLPPDLSFREIPCRMHQSLRDLLAGLLRPENLLLAPCDPSGPAPLCFSSPARGDLLYGGRKVAGAALRVWHDRFLLQGSLQGIPAASRFLQEALVESARRLTFPSGVAI